MSELAVIDLNNGVPDLSQAIVSPSLTPEYLKMEDIKVGYEVRCIFWGVETGKVVDPRTGEEKEMDCAYWVELANGTPRAWCSAAKALVGKLKDLAGKGLERGNPILLRYTRDKKGKNGTYPDWDVHHLYIREQA